MDEILLRADKARVVCDRAQEAWDKSGRESNLEDAINLALCRAQVRNVWRVIRSGYYQLPDELVRALQEAGGEE